MKTKILISTLAFVALAFKNCSNKEEQTQQEPQIQKETIEVVSEKEKWFNSLDSNACKFVQVIDSLPTRIVWEDIMVKAKAYGEPVYVNWNAERIWKETEPEDYSWFENDYNEESGELLKTTRFKGHIGNAYILSVSKEDTWEQIYGGFEIFTKKYVFQYGVLLKPDTIGKKIYPAGTYVATSFLSEEEFNQNKIEFKYFSSYEKFLSFVIENINFSKEFITFGDGIPKPIKISIYL